jgi:hypothetical protein
MEITWNPVAYRVRHPDHGYSAHLASTGDEFRVTSGRGIRLPAAASPFRMGGARTFDIRGAEAGGVRS